MNVNRDKNILSHMVKYCEQIEETVALFGADYDVKDYCRKCMAEE